VYICLTGSFDQSPHLLDVYSNWTESTVAKQPRGSEDLEEDRLKETLADAMVESPMKDIEKLSLRQQGKESYRLRFIIHIYIPETNTFFFQFYFVYLFLNACMVRYCVSYIFVISLAFDICF